MWWRACCHRAAAARSCRLSTPAAGCHMSDSAARHPRHFIARVVGCWRHPGPHTSARSSPRLKGALHAYAAASHGASGVAERGALAFRRKAQSAALASAARSQLRWAIARSRRATTGPARLARGLRRESQRESLSFPGLHAFAAYVCAVTQSSGISPNQCLAASRSEKVRHASATCPWRGAALRGERRLLVCVAQLVRAAAHTRDERLAGLHWLPRRACCCAE